MGFPGKCTCLEMSSLPWISHYLCEILLISCRPENCRRSFWGSTAYDSSELALLKCSCAGLVVGWPGWLARGPGWPGWGGRRRKIDVGLVVGWPRWLARIRQRASLTMQEGSQELPKAQEWSQEAPQASHRARRRMASGPHGSIPF